MKYSDDYDFPSWLDTRLTSIETQLGKLHANVGSMIVTLRENDRHTSDLLEKQGEVETRVEQLEQERHEQKIFRERFLWYTSRFGGIVAISAALMAIYEAIKRTI